LTFLEVGLSGIVSRFQIQWFGFDTNSATSLGAFSRLRRAASP
jgi:hypothetical protein